MGEDSIDFHALAKYRAADEVLVNVDPHQLTQVFSNLMSNATKFSHDKGVVTIQKGGAGLGLPIIKQIIEEMEGRIDFSSSLDHGATFNIYIPLA